MRQFAVFIGLLVSTHMAAHAAPSFRIDPAKRVVSVPRGAVAEYSVDIRALDGFRGNVALQVSGLPTAASVTYSQNPAPAGSSVAIRIQIGNNSAFGNSTLSITGSSGSLRDSVSVVLQVRENADFSIEGNPNVRLAIPGSTASFSIQTRATGGFDGYIAYSVQNVKSNLTATLVSDGRGGIQVNAAVPSGAVEGIHSFRVIARSGNLERSTNLTLKVGLPRFRLSSKWSSRAVLKGKDLLQMVTVTPVNGFRGEVVLSAKGLPSGATASFRPATVRGGGSAVMRVSLPSNAPRRRNRIEVTGSSGGSSESMFFSMSSGGEPDFELGYAPAAQVTSLGSISSYTVSVTPVNGFSDSVSLSLSGLPAGVSAKFEPAVLMGGGQSTLRIDTGLTAVPATFALALTASSTMVTHSAPFNLIISTDPDIRVVSSVDAIYGLRSRNVTNAVAVSGLNGYTGSVALSADGAPAGMTASLSPTSVTVNGNANLTIAVSGSAAPGIYPITLRGVSGDLEHEDTVDVTVLGPVPSQWSQSDIGSQAVTGESGYDTNADRIVSFASGAGIGSTADSFRFVHRQMAGDGEISARLGGLTNGNSGSLQGLMIRETLEPGARSLGLWITASNELYALPAL